MGLPPLLTLYTSTGNIDAQKKQVSNESHHSSKRNFNLCIKPACPLPDSTDNEDNGGDPDADLTASS